jgi:Family of unknown function (DUF5518)
MVKEIIQSRPVIIGTAVAVILYFVSYFLAGQNLMLPLLMLGGILVGYMVGGDLKIGVFNGTIMGVVTGIINIVLLIIMVLVQGANTVLISALAGSLVIYLILQIILAAAGGFFGSMIRTESELDRFPIEEI